MSETATEDNKTEVAQTPDPKGYALCKMKNDPAGARAEAWSTFLMGRSEVDDPEKINAEIQQLLPYTVFWRAVDKFVDGKPVQGVEMLSYLRGKKGGEARLHAKRSVGFGGHVDTEVPDGMPLLLHLANETDRELREEIGLKVDYQKLFQALIRCVRDFNYLVINDGTVNSVHTGLVLLLDWNEHFHGDDKMVLEEGNILDPYWIDVHRLDDEEFEVYEDWSKICIGNMRRMVDEMYAAEKRAAKHLADEAALADRLAARALNGELMPKALDKPNAIIGAVAELPATGT